VISTQLLPELTTSWQVWTQRWRLALMGILTVAISLGFARLVLDFQFVSVVPLLTVLVVAGTVWRPRLGLYMVFGLVLLFEAGGQDPMMLPGWYLHGTLGGTTGLTGVIASPLELLLLLICFAWLARGIARGRLDLRGGRLLWPILAFFVALVFGMMRGPLGGGDLYIAFWEGRFLFYTVICYVLAANTIRTRRHVATLTTITLLATGLFAIEGAYRRVALINTGQLGSVREFFYSHEDVVFLSTYLLLVLAIQVLGAPRWQRIIGLMLAPAVVFTLLASERRAGYIAMIVAFLAFAVVWLITHRKAFCLIAVPLIIGFAVYLPLFWQNTGMAGQPARAIRSMSDPDERDASSNWARELEKTNIKATIAANPLMGVGFGHEYLFVVPTPDVSFWPLWRYETHHNILWLWLKTGVIGFIAFWVLIGTAIVRASHYAKTLREPETRVFALLALAGLFTSLVFCYVDLGLTAGRVPVFLGTIMGTVAVLDQVRE
jgi:O-antigen ligase